MRGGNLDKVLENVYLVGCFWFPQKEKSVKMINIVCNMEWFNLIK